MKYFSDYTQDLQTNLFNEVGAFFAYSDKQFNEAKKDGLKYVSLGYGLICPVGKEDYIMEQLESIQKKGIEQDIKENGIEAIILRELANHEANITYSIDDTKEALDGYDIKEELILDVFKNKFSCSY